MIADLKAKAAGIDKKRAYTAVAALVIAGAAGHVMQRNASTPEFNRVLAASMPAAPLQAPAEPVVAAAGLATAMTLTATPQQRSTEARQTAVGEPGADQDGLEIILAQTANQEDVAARHDALANAPVLALEGAQPVTTRFDEVTRSAFEPNLTFANDPEPTGADAATPEPITHAAADEAIDLVAETNPAIANCEIVLDALPQPGALVALALSAPCNAGEKVEFDHAGLKFSDQIGPEGELFLLVPAMAEPAIIVARVEGGPSQSVEARLPDFVDYYRVALVWKGATGLQLHALEGGANYGDPGHVWAEAPATPEAARAGTGGFLSVLGSTAGGYAADVYTYPAGLTSKGVEPQVSIEAQVMENTCGSRIEGSVLRTHAGRAPTAEPLAIAVPGCDAVGEYLVLNYLPQDLKLARN